MEEEEVEEDDSFFVINIGPHALVKPQIELDFLKDHYGKFYSPLVAV